MKNILKKLMIAFLVLTLALPVGSWSGANAEAAEVTQTQPAKPVKLSKKVLKLKVGQKKKLVLKNAAGKVTWKSKNSSVAKVGRKGVVRAKKSGKTTIIARFGGKKYKCKVTVTAPASSSRSSGSTGSSSSGSSGSSSSGSSSGSSSSDSGYSSGSSSSGSSSDTSKTGTVYWTPGGSVYHYSRSCPTLSRSRIVYSGTPSESGKSRGCKVCG